MGADRLRRDAAILTIRRQPLTSATAPGMSALCEWTRTAHVLSDSRIKTERGTEPSGTTSATANRIPHANTEISAHLALAAPE